MPPSCIWFLEVSITTNAPSWIVGCIESPVTCIIFRLFGFCGVLNYQILGLLKETANLFFKKVGKFKSVHLLVKRYISIEAKDGGQFILLKDADTKEPIDVTEIFERPLRAYTPKGYITTITASEKLEPSVLIEFKMVVWGAKELNPFDKEFLEKMLRVGGEQVGLLQWRNAGYGRFKLQTLELIKEETI